MKEPGTPLHDWLRVRLEALFDEAKAAGFSRDAVVATLIDVVTMPPFDTEPIEGLADR